LILDNFRKLKAYGFKNFSSMKGSLDKGHKAQFQQLIKTVKEGGKPLIDFDDLVNTTRATFAAIESLKTGNRIKVN
jgi:hypothetical protein